MKNKPGWSRNSVMEPLPMKLEDSFSWNVVTKNFHAHEQRRRKLRSKLTKLERHLQRFPHDAVHLQVALERHPKKDLFSAALSLRIPSTLLRSEKQAPDPIPALDRAIKTLLRQLSGFKSGLRREALWKRKERRAGLHSATVFRFADAPMANGTGPQNEGDVIRALIEQHHAELLRFVRRHLWHEVRLGNVPAGAIRCVSRRSNTVLHSSSSVRNCRLRVGCEILKRRAPAEMLPHSTMQTKARSNVRSSKALMQNLHDRYRHSAATRKAKT